MRRDAGIAFLLGVCALHAAVIEPVRPGQPNRQPQLAAQGAEAALVFGAGNEVYFAHSADGGAAWAAPVRVPATGILSLGARRGPRVALTGEAALIAFIAGPKGRGQDGDLWLLRTSDRGANWDPPKRLNGVPGSAREGLHALAAHGAKVAAVWLDLREKGTRLFGAFSDDGGRTWSEDRLIYASPSGSICECCHPSLAYRPDGVLFAMFRNSVEGNRDMYIVSSPDNGRSFAEARKIGSGTWALNACPMDGGSLDFAPDGKPATAWRRGRDVFIADLGLRESRLGIGTQPVSVFASQGRWTVWSQGASLQALAPERPLPTLLAEQGAFASLVSAKGRPLAAWESSGAIRVQFLDTVP